MSGAARMVFLFAPLLAHGCKKWKVILRQQQKIRLQFFSPEQIVREIARCCLAAQEVYVALIIRDGHRGASISDIASDSAALTQRLQAAIQERAH